MAFIAQKHEGAKNVRVLTFAKGAEKWRGLIYSVEEQYTLDTL